VIYYLFPPQEHKASVVQLEERVATVKSRYSVALRNLEQISEQIHTQRGRDRASGGRPAVCGGRSSPVGAEAEVRGHIGRSCAGFGGVESNWADGEKTRLWVERHRESGWGQRERQEAEPDRVSVIGPQAVATDLDACDSVEHLGDMSGAGSAVGEGWGRKQEPIGTEKTTTREKGGASFTKQHHRSVSL